MKEEQILEELIHENELDLLDSKTMARVDPTLLVPLSKAAKASGIDFDKLLLKLKNDGVTDKQYTSEGMLCISDYFIVLHQLSNLTHDEVVQMSDRPLMPGAFHFVLSQACNTSTFEESLRMFSTSFNLLHGATYNHVYITDNTIVYSIDNNNFPYPFKVTSEQSQSIMECIMILMHSLFIMCNGPHVNSLLLKTTTTRSFPRNSPAPHQLKFWKVPIASKSKSFSLVYDIAAINLSPIVKPVNLPPANEIFSKVADMIMQQSITSPLLTKTSFKQTVHEHLLAENSDEDNMAEKLHISKRTLRRRLKNADTTFKELKQNSLNSKAKRLLEQEFLIEEIAENLGYSDERSFRRAFSSWNKITPKQYQTQLCNQREIKDRS